MPRPQVSIDLVERIDELLREEGRQPTRYHTFEDKLAELLDVLDEDDQPMTHQLQGGRQF